MGEEERTLDELAMACGLSGLGEDAPPEAIQATAEQVAELRRTGELSSIEEAMLRDLATKAWKRAGYRASVELWDSTEPAYDPDADDEEPQEPEKTVEELYEEGREVLEAPDQLALFREEVRRQGYAGTTAPAELVHLAFHSRNLDRPINVALEGASASGKTHTVDVTKVFHPADRIRDLAGSSARALAYTPFDTEHGYVIIGEASALHKDGVGASIIRSVAWGQGIRYETVEKNAGGQIESRLIKKPGPTGLITTSTRDLDPEVATRMLRVTITDSPTQTRAVVRSIGREAAGELEDDPDLTPWISASRWLERKGVSEVVVPWAPQLMEEVPVDDVRMRRDARQLVMVVQASAFVHQVHRERDSVGRVVASPADYTAAFRLLGSVLSVSLDQVTEAIRETVRAVERLNKSESGHWKGVSYPELAEELGLSRSGANRRGLKALKDGYLANAEERPGYPAKLVTADPLPTPRAVLPSPEELFGDISSASTPRETLTVSHPGRSAPVHGDEEHVSEGVRQREIVSEEDSQYSEEDSQYHSHSQGGSHPESPSCTGTEAEECETVSALRGVEPGMCASLRFKEMVELALLFQEDPDAWREAQVKRHLSFGPLAGLDLEPEPEPEEDDESELDDELFGRPSDADDVFTARLA